MSDLQPGLLDETNVILGRVAKLLENGTQSTPFAADPTSVSATSFTPDLASVIASCLLYASLCCSILSACGAVLGKEWLRYFNQRPPLTSLGDQVRFRQKKFKGTQGWYLRETIEMLPSLLLVSVFLFFIGLIPYLLRLNKAVAWTVIAFLACGVVFWARTVYSCLRDHHSPYQTHLTLTLRKAYTTLFRVADVDNNAAPGTSGPHKEAEGAAGTEDSHDDAKARTGTECTDATAAASTEETLSSNLVGGIAKDIFTMLVGRVVDETPHVVDAETVIRLLGVTSEPKHLNAIARGMCRLEVKARRVLLRHDESWQRLLDLARDAIKRWQSGLKDEDRLTAEFLGAAICRLFMDSFSSGDRDPARWKQVEERFPDEVFQARIESGGDQKTLSVLKSTLLAWRIKDVWISEVKAAGYDLRKCFLQRHTALRTALEWTVLVGFVQIQYDDNILSLLAAFIRARFGNETDDYVRKMSIRAYTGKELASNIEKALDLQEQAFSDSNNVEPKDQIESRDAFAEIYAAFFKRAKEFTQNEMAFKSKSDDHIITFLERLSKRVLPSACTQEWIESSMEAVMALTPPKLPQTEGSTDQRVPTCESICNALTYIVEGTPYIIKSGKTKGIKIGIDQFILATLKAISADFASPGWQWGSMGDGKVFTDYFFSALESVESDEWLEFFAQNPKAIPSAEKVWKESRFASEILKSFKITENKEQGAHLASIMVHIASTKSEEWCKQLDDGTLTDVVESVLAAEGKKEKPTPNISSATALRPFVAVLAVGSRDWGTEQMHRILGILSARVIDDRTDLLGEIKEIDGESGINRLQNLIEQVSKCRQDDAGSALGKIKDLLKKGST
ncbi:hypothetical protein FRC01_003281 [Tulasnella sp. 417]|nr:hypothetical protein FRC01_003281 [Tulasnella sp. 417]